MLMSMLIKLSGLCGIILLFMVIGTAHTNNILVEENVLVQMNREETIRMNRLNLNQDPKCPLVGSAILLGARYLSSILRCTCEKNHGQFTYEYVEL